MEHTVPLVYNLKKTGSKNHDKKLTFYCLEPRSFEVAKATFQSQEICPYECQDTKRCFLIFYGGEQGSSAPPGGRMGMSL